MKAILLTLDLLFGALIFTSLLFFVILNYEFENKPSLYYYDASNALDFMENELGSKNASLINNSIYSYLSYKEYYFEINYYNSTSFVQKIMVGDKKKNSNYCSQKYYYINGELVDATLCIWRDY